MSELDSLVNDKDKYRCPTFKRWLYSCMAAAGIVLISLAGIIAIFLYFLIGQPDSIVPLIIVGCLGGTLLGGVGFSVWLYYVKPK